MLIIFQVQFKFLNLWIHKKLKHTTTLSACNEGVTLNQLRKPIKKQLWHIILIKEDQNKIFTSFRKRMMYWVMPQNEQTMTDSYGLKTLKMEWALRDNPQCLQSHLNLSNHLITTDNQAMPHHLPSSLRLYKFQITYQCSQLRSWRIFWTSSACDQRIAFKKVI